MIKSNVIVLMFMSFMIVHSSNAQTQLSFPMKPGDVQVYTFNSSNPKDGMHIGIRSTTRAMYFDAEENTDNTDDTVRVVRRGYLIGEVAGTEAERINERGMVTIFNTDRWVEIFPAFIPLRDTIQLFQCRDVGSPSPSYDTTNYIVQRRFDTTIFGRSVHAFTLMSNETNPPEKITIADTFGLVYALEGFYLIDTLKLNSAVINGIQYNREARNWNFLSLCDDNEYQYLYTQEESPSIKKKTMRVSGDTVIQGVTYKILGGLYPAFVRTAPDGIHISGEGNDQMYLPSNAELGTIVDRYVVTDTGSVLVGNKLRRWIKMSFGLRDFYENLTWIEDVGIIKIVRWGYAGGYMTDTLVYAHFCNDYFGTPLPVQQDITKPTSISLSQNAPNPFTPSTFINYKVAALSHIRLEIFDLLGRKVATLVDEEKNAGEYTSMFVVRSSSAGGGFDMPSGIYLYRLSAGANMLTRKMVVMQ